jgi:NAD(P)-dependent dehydrogenase (short-subunit alcohol dehydrogenase family)
MTADSAGRVDPPRSLVTGASGAIGQALVTALLGRGHTVVAVDARAIELQDERVVGVQGRLGSLDETAPTVEGTIHHTFLVAGGALPDEAQGLPLELTESFSCP